MASLHCPNASATDHTISPQQRPHNRIICSLSVPEEVQVATVTVLLYWVM